MQTHVNEDHLLPDINNTCTPYPEDKSISALFEEQAKQNPHAIALIYKDERMTYQDLNQRANQLAHYLIKLGVKAKMLVGIYLERSFEMLIGLLAILKAGGAYLPLDRGSIWLLFWCRV
jgi:microcystin synthetase protein McyA